MIKYKLKNGMHNKYGTIFLKILANIFVWNFKWLKIDVIFISPYEFQIIFSFNFLVLKMYDYEISKRAIIHMDFITHFPKYYNF